MDTQKQMTKDYSYYLKVKIPELEEDQSERIHFLWNKIDQKQGLGTIELYFLFSMSSNAYVYYKTRNKICRNCDKQKECHQVMQDDLLKLAKRINRQEQ